MEKKIVALIFIIPLFFSVGIYAAQTKKIERTENKPYKNVEFNFETHKQKFNNVLECEFCHHDEYGEEAEEIISCATAECHLGHDGTEMFHNTCIGYHKESGEDAPIRCIHCHKG